MLPCLNQVIICQIYGKKTQQKINICCAILVIWVWYLIEKLVAQFFFQSSLCFLQSAHLGAKLMFESKPVLIFMVYSPCLLRVRNQNQISGKIILQESIIHWVNFHNLPTKIEALFSSSFCEIIEAMWE